MKRQDIPTYNDPDDFEDEVKYPCNTQYMVYNPLQHKYFLTEEALNYYGLDIDRKYITDNPNPRREFIEKVTKKVYDYIAYKSGWKCFQVIQYRIAKSLAKAYEPYEVRHQIQECLIAQARFLLENGDATQFSINNYERGVLDARKPEEDFMDTGDISPEVKRTLNYLGYDRWFSVVQWGKLNNDEF